MLKCRSGVACGVVVKAAVSTTQEILSLVRFPTPPSKLMQAAVRRKRVYKAACNSCQKRQLANPSPQKEASACHTDCFIHTNLTYILTCLPTKHLAGCLVSCGDRLPLTDSVCFIGSLCQIRLTCLIM